MSRDKIGFGFLRSIKPKRVKHCSCNGTRLVAARPYGQRLQMNRCCVQQEGMSSHGRYILRCPSTVNGEAKFYSSLNFRDQGTGWIPHGQQLSGTPTLSISRDCQQCRGES
jgi:hypothetical protein